MSAIKKIEITEIEELKRFLFPNKIRIPHFPPNQM